MAWTAPRTWVTGETVTAALMNAHIRDNFLETSAATVTTAGDLVYADAANSMGTRLAIGAANSHLVSTSSAPVWRDIVTAADTGSYTGSPPGSPTSYAVLSSASWSTGNAVAVTVTTGTEALVLLKAQLANSAAGSTTFLAYSISGATTRAASNNSAISYEASVNADLAQFGGFDLAISLTAGSNTFTLEGRVSANTGTITRPEIVVIAY